MYRYLEHINNKENWDKVAEVIQPILEGDLVTEEIIKSNIKGLEKLKDLGEDRLYKIIVEELKRDHMYKDYI